MKREVLPMSKRKLLKHCEDGDGLRFRAGAPIMRQAGISGRAPSDVARLMFWVYDKPFVRFLVQVDGRLGEPAEVDPDLEIELLATPPWHTEGANG
jgi:hypothetical protein